MPPSQRNRRRAGRKALLEWYRPRAAAYPWRTTRDPYAVLVSEVMLQQTQAARVVEPYRTFLRRYPSVASLAAAPRSDVIRAWGSLGYNPRAVRLSEAARAVVRDHAGLIPRRSADLLGLPGVGPYTAAAVASIGFGEPVAAVDTNVRRVVARVHLGVDGTDAPAKEVAAFAQTWLDPSEPGAWNQAVMDLGREICRPRPRCEVCPLARGCRYRRDVGAARAAPRRQGPFEGSTRQVRGAVVRALRSRDTLTRAALVTETGFPRDRVEAAVATLAADGLVDESEATVRLAR